MGALPARGAVAAAVLAGHGEALQTVAWTTCSNRPGPTWVRSRGRGVLADVRTRPWEAERAAACSEQGPEQWPRTWADTGGLLWNQVQSLVTRVRAATGEQAHARSRAEGNPL